MMGLGTDAAATQAAMALTLSAQTARTLGVVAPALSRRAELAQAVALGLRLSSTVTSTLRALFQSLPVRSKSTTRSTRGISICTTRSSNRPT